MPVSKYGEQRMRKRLGLPKKIVAKQSYAAYHSGLAQSSFKGKFRKYLDYWCIEYGSIVRIYQGNMYFYKIGGVTHNDPVLITCWPIPSKYKKQLKDYTDATSNN